MRALGLLLMLPLLALTVRAEAESIDLSALALGLRHESDEARAEAAEKLSQLSREDLPAIDARLTALKRRVIDPEEGYQALRSFAHAVGSRRADDPIDIEPGIHQRLKESRPSVVEAAIAEELLLLRSLEKMRSARAYRRAAQIFALHFDVFRWEARHSMARMGFLAMPAILDGISSGDAGLAAASRAAHAALGQPGPAEALRELEGEDRAELLLVYASRRVMDAMESAAIFLNDPDPVVRRAAIAAVKRYGRNAIWQIREAALLFLGEELDRSMGHEESLEYLLKRLDVQRAKPQLLLLQQSRRFLEEGELEKARAAVDRLWAERPELDEDGVGSAIYEALGERALERGEFAEAGAAFRQASLLARDDERRNELEGRVKAVQRQRLKSEGYFYLEKDASEAAPPEAGEPDSEEGEGPSTLPRVLFLIGVFLLIGWERFFRGGRWALAQLKRAGAAMRRARGPMMAKIARTSGLAMRAARAGLERGKAAGAAMKAELKVKELAKRQGRQEAKQEAKQAAHQEAQRENQRLSPKVNQARAEQPVIKAPARRAETQVGSSEARRPRGQQPSRPAEGRREQLPMSLLKAPKIERQDASAGAPQERQERQERPDRAQTRPAPAEAAPALPASLVFGRAKAAVTADAQGATGKPETPRDKRAV